MLPHVDLVANDDEHGARLATEHLIALGHRRIAHIAGQGMVGELRRRSFETVMREHGLADTAVVEQGDLTEEGGYRATVRLLSARERPTAVFAFNDIACVGALSAAEELGLRCRTTSPSSATTTPTSRACATCGSPPWTAPATTSAAAPHSCLLDRIADPARPAEVVLSTPVLEVRGTTAAPRESPA